MVNKIENLQDVTPQRTIESKKLYLEKKLKSAKNKLKKYIKEDDRFWITKMNYSIYDLEEQLKELENV
jgi:hypothetical protein